MSFTSDNESAPGPEHAERTSVMLVDDHTSIRQMLAFVLPREGPYDIVAQVSSGIDAMDVWRIVRPKVMVLDIMLPELSGIEIVRRLHQEGSQTRLLIYSGTNNKSLIAEAMAANPHGFVHKEDSLDTFRQAIKTVSSGGRFITASATTSAVPCANIRDILTDNEILVLQLIAEGHPQKAIAERMGVTVRTVEYHRRNLSNKLGIFDIAGLTKYAIRHGLISIQ
jgi:DNA-binding NarL/FixJ family response regulator